MYVIVAYYQQLLIHCCLLHVTSHNNDQAFVAMTIVLYSLRNDFINMPICPFCLSVDPFIIVYFLSLTDSGHGTSSRPASMVTNEGENLPLTPHSTRSTFTTVTTDSDPTKSLSTDVRLKNMDTLSILSDASGTSGFSGTLPNHLSRIRRSTRPQVRNVFLCFFLSYLLECYPERRQCDSFGS